MMAWRTLTILGVSFLALTACSGVREFVYEKYTGERTGDAVAGPRRPPILNPAAAKAVAQAPARPAAQAAPSAAAATPYDQYDNKGNEVGSTNYVKEWFGDKPGQPAAGRKSFKGVVASADAPAPVVLKPRVTSPAAVPAPEEENGVFIDIPEERSQAPTEATLAQLQPAAGSANAPGEYPYLASVPKVPPQFKAVKAEKDAQLKDLQQNYDAAMEQKKALDAEPTELPPATLPQVQGMIDEINEAVHGETPIVQAKAATIQEASPSAGN